MFNDMRKPTKGSEVLSLPEQKNEFSNFSSIVKRTLVFLHDI